MPRLLIAHCRYVSRCQHGASGLGPGETIYFNPADTNVAIVTCGGLCPGLNDVVQGLVRKLEDYGVPEGNILGIRWFPAPHLT